MLYIGIILIIVYVAYVKWQNYLPPQDAGSMDNEEALGRDRLKLYSGDMTRTQFIQNIKNGKYRKVDK